MERSLKTQKTKEKKKSRPSSSFANYVEMSTDEDVGKDFDTLISAPLSKNGHFVFKSEKAWSVDSSQYSEFFTLNLKTLSVAIDCIPFNEYINVNNRYFILRYIPLIETDNLKMLYPMSMSSRSKESSQIPIMYLVNFTTQNQNDQLTNINNDAEKRKLVYSTTFYPNISSSSNIIFSKSEMDENTKTDQSRNLKSTENTKFASENNINNLEEEIEFLLSLKEPIQNNPTISQLISTSHNDSKIKPQSAPIKPTDLEKWLDTVLDD